MFKYLQIETTTFCNATCWFCPNHLVPKQHMPWELFTSVIDSTRGMGITYRPFGLGEPLVDPRIEQILSYIKQDPTAKIEIHTNGAPLSQKIEDKIVPYVDLVRFSIDGITSKTFDESRGISFDLTYHNAKRFIVKNRNIDVEVRMINLPGTEDEQWEYLNYWNNVRPGCALITELYEHPWTTQTESTNDPCVKCQDEAFVYIDGSVHPCCWDFDDREILGNIKEQSLIDIWKSHKFKQLRERLLKGERNKYNLCSRCDAKF